MTSRRAAALCLACTCGCSAPKFAHEAQRELASSSGLSCDATMVWDLEPVEHVGLFMAGTGIGSMAWVHPSVAPVVQQRRLAWIVFDKPGIHATFGDPSSAAIDEEEFRAHTQGDLLECAEAALRWSREVFGSGPTLHLRGHSEGSYLLPSLYLALLQRGDELARGVRHVILSGLSLEHVADALDRQTPLVLDGEEDPELVAAVRGEDCDDDVLRRGFPVSCTYLADARTRPSGREVFEQLAAQNAPAGFTVFHGTQDWNAPVDLVRDLEQWNTAQGSLDMSFHYYEGGHMGTEASRAEGQELLLDLFASE